MMAVFDMVTAPTGALATEYDIATDVISDQYFTIDTADLGDVGEWVKFNRHLVTYAAHQGKVLGFFNVLPLTMECGALFEREAIKEEDLRVQHILPHDLLPHAQYAYIAAIAVDHTENYISRQCAAALMACMADLFLHGYGAGLKKIFANPTTFQGHKLVSRLGLKPVAAFKKGLTENDIYQVVMDDEARHNLANLASRYARFVGDNPWRPDAFHHAAA